MLASSTVSPRLQSIVDKIDDLPTLPSVVLKMMQLIDKEDTSAQELSKVIETDPVLMARLLKIANSAIYGFPRQISTLELAIVALGFNQLKCLGVSLCVVDQFGQISDRSLFDLNRFWKHSAGCGVASRMLARVYGYPVAAEAFVAGLLHDIGKLIIYRYFPREFEEILLLVRNAGMSFTAAERIVMDVTHSEVGWWLADTWNMPPELVSGIAYHHNPAEADVFPEIAMLVHLADVLCRTFHMGSGGDEAIPDVTEDAIAILSKKHPAVQHPEDLNLNSYESRFQVEAKESEAFLNLIRSA